MRQRSSSPRQRTTKRRRGRPRRLSIMIVLVAISWSAGSPRVPSRRRDGRAKVHTSVASIGRLAAGDQPVGAALQGLVDQREPHRHAGVVGLAFAPGFGEVALQQLDVGHLVDVVARPCSPRDPWRSTTPSRASPACAACRRPRSTRRPGPRRAAARTPRSPAGWISSGGWLPMPRPKPSLCGSGSWSARPGADGRRRSRWAGIGRRPARRDCGAATTTWPAAPRRRSGRSAASGR